MGVSNYLQVFWVYSVSYSDNEDIFDVVYMNRINIEFQKVGVRGLLFLFVSGDNGVGCKKKRFRFMFLFLFFYVIIVGGIVFNDFFIVFSEYGYDISGGGFSFIFLQLIY